MSKTFLLIFVFLIFPVSYAYAEAIAISPARLQFELYRGETAESTVTLFNPTENEVRFKIGADDHQDWFSFSESEGTLAPEESKKVKVRVNPPSDSANGEYTTLISLSFDEESSGQISLNLATAIKTKIILTGKQVVNLITKNIEAMDTEQSLPIVLKISLLNGGNVRTRPTAEVILKKNNRILERLIVELPEILPNSESDFYLNLSAGNLEVGDYLAVIRLRLNNRDISENQLTLRIHPLGTFTRVGILSNLSFERKPALGEITKLIAEFQNTGRINLRAKLISEIYLNNQLIGKVESEEKLVWIGEKAELTAYLKPGSEGAYRIISRILFEGEETELKELTFEITHLGISLQNTLIGIMIALSITGLGLAIFFRKEVNKMFRKPIKSKKQEEKVYYCIDCNRPIKHKGRCFLCNKTAKMRKEAQDRKYE